MNRPTTLATQPFGRPKGEGCLGEGMKQWEEKRVRDGISPIAGEGERWREKEEEVSRHECLVAVVIAGSRIK